MEGILYWHWWIFAGALLVLKIVRPDGFYLMMAVCAAVISGVLFAFPDLVWEYQVIMFAVFTIVSIALWKRYAKKPQRDPVSRA